MDDRNQQYPPINQTSAPAPSGADFAVSTLDGVLAVTPAERTNYDRNRDSGQGTSMPYSEYDRNYLFRTPQSFRRPGGDVRREQGGVSGGTSEDRPTPGSTGHRSDSAQSGLSAGQLLTQAIEKERDPWERIECGVVPHYSLRFKFMVGILVALAIAAGAFLGYVIVLAVTR